MVAAGAEEAHANLLDMSNRVQAEGAEFSKEEYEASRTFPNSVKALREFAAKVWAEGWREGASDGAGGLGLHDVDNPYKP